MSKLVFFEEINEIHKRISSIEDKLNSFIDKTQRDININRTHLTRVKNGQELSDEYTLSGNFYYDLTPEKAFKIYSDHDEDFILLDVSKKSFKRTHHLPEAIEIPYHELGIRHREIISKNTMILVISEDGTSSILACELLNQLGFYNVNNISGGYKFWPGSRQTILRKVI